MTMLENMTGMQLGIRSCDPTSYDWDPATEEGVRPKPLPSSDYTFHEGVPPDNDPSDFAIVGGVRSATVSWTFDDVHTVDVPMYCGRVWRAVHSAGFANAIEVSGPRVRYRREASHLETWTDSVRPGSYDYFLSVENSNGDMRAPLGPISVVVT